MRKYRFKLASLERHRTLTEQQKRVVFSKRLAEVRQTESRLLEIDDSEVRARRAYAALGESGTRDSLTSAQFWVIDSFIQGQKVRRIDAKKELEQREKTMRQAHADYIHARQDLRIIETLREKDHARYRKERSKFEMKQLDETYTMRDRLSERGRKKGGGDNE